MIFVRDKGRMCNNMLQYGHLYAWGREHGRQTMSMRFAYKYRYFRICHTPHHNFATYLLAKYGAKAGIFPVVSFDVDGADYSREEELLMSRRWVVAQGWYARWYDLFLKYKAEITDLFAFDAEIERRVASAMAVAERGSEDVVRLGLHLRRGDYATWHNGDFLYTDEQYADVAKRFMALHGNRPVRVYICGNDPQMNSELFVRVLGDCVTFPDGSPGEDLCLLSHCHYLIGPPSTFTLVAAMYHDALLYWVKDMAAPVDADSFATFDTLFRKIL